MSHVCTKNTLYTTFECSKNLQARSTSYVTRETAFDKLCATCSDSCCSPTVRGPPTTAVHSDFGILRGYGIEGLACAPPRDSAVVMDGLLSWTALRMQNNGGPIFTWRRPSYAQDLRDEAVNRYQYILGVLATRFHAMQPETCGNVLPLIRSCEQ